MEIYLHVSGQQTGPYAEDELREMVGSGRASRRDFAWREGMPEWQPLEELVALPPRPAPPPLPKSMAGLPHGLPPLPPKARATPSAAVTSAMPRQPSSVIRTVSGVIALLLGLLTIFNVGGCMDARGKLATFQDGDDALSTANMLVDTARGMHNNDPLRGINGLLDHAGTLQDDYRSARLAAWLCLIGTAVAGGVCAVTASNKAK